MNHHCAAPRASRVLLLAGDVMTGRGIDQVLMHPGEPTLHEGFVKDARDYVRLAEAVNGPVPVPVAADYPWGDALADMQRVAPDLRIVNLETAITQGGTPWPTLFCRYGLCWRRTEQRPGLGTGQAAPVATFPANACSTPTR